MFEGTWGGVNIDPLPFFFHSFSISLYVSTHVLPILFLTPFSSPLISSSEVWGSVVSSPQCPAKMMTSHRKWIGPNTFVPHVLRKLEGICPLGPVIFVAICLYLFSSVAPGCWWKGQRMSSVWKVVTLCNVILFVTQSGYTYFVMRGSVNASNPDGGRVLVCMRAAANHSEAISPAFLDDEGCTTQPADICNTVEWNVFFLSDVWSLTICCSCVVNFFLYLYFICHSFGL